MNKRVHEGQLQRKATLFDVFDEEDEEDQGFDETTAKETQEKIERLETHRGMTRYHSRSVLVTNKEFFEIEKDEKPVKMKQSSIHVASYPRMLSISSEDELILSSRQDISQYSQKKVGQLGVPTSPVQSEAPAQCKSLEASELALSFQKGSEILKEDPIFTEMMQESESGMETPPALPEITALPKENLMNPYASDDHRTSYCQSPAVPESSTSALSPESTLMRMAFFRKRRQKAGHLKDQQIAYSISDNWQLETQSKDEVLKQQGRKVQTPARVVGGFFYVDKVKEAQKEDGSEDVSHSVSNSKISLTLYQRFLELCMRTQTKLAYRALVPVASTLVQAAFVLLTQESDSQEYATSGEWSGGDVRDVMYDSVDLEPYNVFEFKRWKPGWRGKVQKLTSPFYYLTKNSYFNLFMTLCVVLNTVVLAINHYGIDADSVSALDTCNLVFTILFTIEMLVKMIGLGILRYFKDRMNIFDCLIVMLSLLELSLISGSGLAALRAIRVFRAFRALRVARLFRSMRYMQTILTMIGKSIENFMYMGLLLFLFQVVFSLFGMQLFGGKFNFDDGKPRSNYDNFHYAFLTTFQLLTMENWFTVLYDGMRTSLGNAASIYFVIWIFFGNFVLLNLLLAILLDSFSTLSADDEIESEELQRLEATSDLLKQKSGPNYSRRKQRKIDLIMRKIEALKEEESLDSNSGSASMDAVLGAKRQKQLFQGNECVKSYFFLSKKSKIRIWCFQVTSSSQFEWSIMVLIVISSLKLIWETYLFDEPVGSTKDEISNNLDTVFTILFSMEFLLKSISLGFVVDEGTYLRDTWNILDFIIVLFSMVDMLTTSINLAIIKVFRLLRALRPLRLISHNKSMRIIVNALIESFQALANVSIVILIVWLIFAILGVSLMAGKMYVCSNASITTESECLYYGFDWVNSPYHFDNVIHAYRSLFDLTSQENWPDLMYQGTDTFDTGKAMQTNCNPFMAYYFVVFVLISNVFFLNLLLGVMFDKFEKAKRSNSSISELLLQNDQLRWVEMMKLIIRTKRIEAVPVVTSPSRLCVLGIINHWMFGAFIMSCIVCNMITMALAYDEASAQYTKVLENLNLTFTSIFCLEASLKLFGLTVKGYFNDRWNCFDFFVVISSLLDIILGLTVFSSGSNKILTVGPQLARTLRILRVSRLFRLIKKLRMIDDLVGMITLSIPAIANVFALLVLVFTIYGVLGVYLFHSYTQGRILDEYNNFSNFGYSVLILIRASTGEDWNYIENDISIHTNPIISVIYFQTFVSITTFIMFNMFIMVMLQEYETYHNNPDSSFVQYKEALKKFNTAWNKCIPIDNKLRMDAEMLIAFAYEMGKVIKVEPSWNRYEVKLHLNQIGLIPDQQGFVYYHDALFRCLRSMFNGDKRPKSKVHRKLLEKEEQIHTKQIRKLVKMDKISSVAKFMHSGEKTRGGDMQFVDLIFLKTVFKSWKNYSSSKKDKSGISETPAMSINNPGVNSPLSLTIEVGEEECGKEDRFRRSSQTLQLSEVKLIYSYHPATPVKPRQLVM